jgi:hypothetical protein
MPLQSNLHETTLAEGERKLATVQEEIRGLRINVRELERSLHLARGRFPETPMWAERILELQKALVQSRQVRSPLGQPCYSVKTTLFRNFEMSFSAGHGEAVC